MKRTNGPFKPTTTDPYGWGEDRITYDLFLDAVGKNPDWRMVPKVDSNRTFLGNGRYTIWHDDNPTMEVVDTRNPETGRILLRDNLTTAPNNGYVLTPNQLKNFLKLMTDVGYPEIEKVITESNNMEAKRCGGRILYFR